jgi:hypothetical protein
MEAGIVVLSGRVLSFNYLHDRWRFGITGAEFYPFPPSSYDNDVFVGPLIVGPVRAGYTLWRRPNTVTGIWKSMVPEVFAEGSVGLNPEDWRPMFRAGMVCQLDFAGMGIGAELGGYAEPYTDITWGWQYKKSWFLAPYLSLRLRVLPLTFALGETGTSP